MRSQYVIYKRYLKCHSGKDSLLKYFLFKKYKISYKWKHPRYWLHPTGDNFCLFSLSDSEYVVIWIFNDETDIKSVWNLYQISLPVLLFPYWFMDGVQCLTLTLTFFSCKKRGIHCIWYFCFVWFCFDIGFFLFHESSVQDYVLW